MKQKVKLIIAFAISCLLSFLIGISTGKKLNTCGEWIVDNKHIPMPEYYRHITGMDTIQLILKDTWVWSDDKKKVVPSNGHIEANFCYPNRLKN